MFRRFVHCLTRKTLKLILTFLRLALALCLIGLTLAETVQIGGLLTNLRENWESPIAYLETRGYLEGKNGTAKNQTFVETTMNATKVFIGKLKQTWNGWFQKQSNSSSNSSRGIFLNLSTTDLETMKNNIETDKKLIHCMLDSFKNINSSKLDTKAGTSSRNSTKAPPVVTTITAIIDPCANETDTSKYITRKLEYLAHLHHPVESVGNKNEAVNLKKIQALIDDIKYSPDNGIYDLSRSVLLPPYAENYLTRRKRTARAKSFTEKLTEISRHLNKSLIKGEPEAESQSETSDGSPKEIEMDDLSLHLSDEQTAEIEKFRNDLSAPPQQFNFDIQPFLEISPNKLGTEVESELVTSRTYFEFEDFQKQDDKRALKPLDSHVTLNVPAMHQRPLQRDLMEYDKDANEFIDRYYMLNDGQTNVDEVLPVDEKNIMMPSNLNMEDLNIDLKLNKEFRELEAETGQRRRPEEIDQQRT
jgi:hypothetical protein